MKVELQLSGVDGVLATLQSLPAEVVSKRGGPVRKALRKGAVVIHRAAKANLQRATSSQTASGEQESTGLLIKNLVISRGKAPTTGKGERQLVRVRRKVYLGRRGSKPTTTLKTAQILEYGSEKQPAEPWLRPAFHARAREAITTIERETIAEIDKVVKKLAAQNRSR